MDNNKARRIDTVVIGGGQAGLSVGFHLQKRGVPFVILEAEQRIGDSWRKRWDSLRLFTPAMYDAIAGLPFPAPRYSFPTKDEMADYLESYASHFALPVQTGIRVDRLSKKNGRFLISSGDRSIEADNVVVAMATFQNPRLPEFARELDPGIRQLHSSAYRNPSQLQPGGVLIVGAGNSGAEIAVEVARSHRTWMSGRDVGHVPFDMAGPLARLFLVRFLFRFVFHRVLTLSTPLGRKARPAIISKGGILIRVKPAHLASVGVERVPRMVGVRGGKPLLANQRVVEASNVIWCTGFHPGFSWIDLPVIDREEPPHWRGIVEREPGLYFVGLHFLYAFSSTMIHGVGRDAEFIADAIASRERRREQDATLTASTPSHATAGIAAGERLSRQSL